jgi:hypothetical protein
VRGKRDANHADIVQVFRDTGCTVADTADVGAGFPDLVVGISGYNVLVEVKSEAGALTPDQVRFHADWRGGKVQIVRSAAEAIELVNKVRRGK